MSELVWAIDCSSHQPRNLGPIIAEHRPEHVVVKLYLSAESIPKEHSRAQVRSAWEHGATAGGYVWAYRSVDPTRTITEAIDLCNEIGLVLPILWVDAETYNGSTFDPGPDAAWLRQAFATADSLSTPCGIYSGTWWIRGHFPGGEAAFSEFKDRPLWLSIYDGTPDLSVGYVPQGFPGMAGKQWGSEPIDRNVFLPEVARLPAEPQPEPGPDNEVARLREQVEGLRIALDDVVQGRLRARVEVARTELIAAEADLNEALRIRTQFLGQP